MKVIFLDIDGVLNAGDDPYAGQEHALDRGMIERLNGLAGESGAQIVLTSTWRLFYPWPQCRDILRAYGLTAPVIGETRSLYDEDAVAERRQEIHDWLSRNPLRSYVVLDDLDLYPDTEPRFVRTEERLGLTDGDVERARRALDALLEP